MPCSLITSSQMSQIHLACVVRDWHMCHYCLAERWSVPLMRGFNADGRGGAFLPPRCHALRGVSSLRFLPSPLLGSKSAADQSFLKRWAADDRVPPNSDRHRFLCRRWHVVGGTISLETWQDFKEIKATNASVHQREIYGPVQKCWLLNVVYTHVVFI